MPRQQHKPLNGNGFASIVIALVLIIVLALLTVGFAQLARREQQDALDKQLASQAYDAAESGINDAYADIQSGKLNEAIANRGTQCIDTSSLPTDLRIKTPDIDAAHGVSYSCLMVDLTPPTLKKTLEPSSAWTTAFKVVGQDNSDRALKSFTVQWSSHDGHTGSAPSGLPPAKPFNNADQWNNAPALLAFSITPLCAPPASPAGASCSVDRNTLENSVLTAYLHPDSSGGASLTYPATGGNPNSSTSPYSDAEGQMIQAHCTGATCSVTVNISPGVGGHSGQEYLIHVMDYYDQSDISIINPIDTDGQPAYFANSQAVIDVTGKARQVLKRLQAVVPIGKTNPPLPSYGIEAQDLCKLLNTTVNILPDGSPGGTRVNTSGLPAPGDPNNACSLN
jgi:Tfp pilus assembly protein PilX